MLEKYVVQHIFVFLAQIYIKNLLGDYFLRKLNKILLIYLTLFRIMCKK